MARPTDTQPSPSSSSVAPTNAPPVDNVINSHADDERLVIPPTPGKVSIIGDSIHFTFPIQAALRSPVEGCFFASSGERWTTEKHSLKRHIRKVHNTGPLTDVRWCSYCNSIVGPRVHAHPCLSGMQFFLPAIDGNDNFPYKCRWCNFSAQSHRGIVSHTRTHKRADLRTKIANSRNTAASRTQQRSTSNTSPVTRDTNVSQRSDMTDSAVNDSAPSNEHVHFVLSQDGIADVNTPEDSHHSSYFSNLTIDPDAPTPSDAYIDPFKAFLGAPTASSFNYEWYRQNKKETN